ncbi:MAG TPA: Si-specific NAD(P)(+) transhydrogenase [Chromatiaceae bacterium]|jgi:NAD(P) transhydrogenase|nr:Si-specific NAD(P)(+) transhydrogenase [Chromatiaceae bacterium]HIB83178.1 Si-specific NAD(P)(+) transhydrogenase [Chromatiaceae bacterium]HIN82233.1 Si-specific NAD(P)(+) transhydrogenase [Chromatiales bacterium]HIO14545.1 Si-specific NAD(P)(+) transhydrogenase [Chromatiales bacterium]HIO54066.1 Si-specific NAD(P)(+) transhydrogenase [Chromatiales bacterium]
MSQHSYDFIVIGSGPAGQRAAIQAAKLHKSVALIERKSVVGGVSLHTGTIPSKTLRETVLYLSGWRQRGFYGRSYRVKQNITAEDLLQRLEITIRHEVEVIQHQLFRNGVCVIDGSASFQDPHTILVQEHDGLEHTIHADKILIATGTSPHRPNDIPFDGSSVIDSDDILNLHNIPRSLTVIGAGVIGVEYASIFNALDTEVTLVDGRETMLDFVDGELVDEFIHHLRDRGVNLRMGESVSRVEKDDRGRVITYLESGRRICSEQVMFAAGRTGATATLGLDKAGLEADSRGRIKVNENYQTDVAHIYAAGDVIGFPSLASTSMEQGRISACHAFGLAAHSCPENFPFGIYGVPEISLVGLTEQDARAKGIAYETGTAQFREISRGQILGLREGMLKMLFSLEDQRVLGVHIVGEGATELIHIGQAVMALGGTLSYFVENVFNYPTLAEAYKVAALDAYNKMADWPVISDEELMDKSG